MEWIFANIIWYNLKRISFTNLLKIVVVFVDVLSVFFYHFFFQFHFECITREHNFAFAGDASESFPNIVNIDSGRIRREKYSEYFLLILPPCSA